MHNILREQFFSFQKLVNNNLLTIKDLLAQVEKLSQLVEQEKNEDTKKALKEIQLTLENKLEDLINSTEKLFEIHINSVSK